MEKRKLYAIIAIILVIVVVIAAISVILYKSPTTVAPSPTAPTLVSVTPSTQFASVGSTIQFVASVTGNVTAVSWNFGDGTTGTGLIVNHTYVQPGEYLVFANATGTSGYSNNLKSLIPITISPKTINPEIANEMTEPVLTLNTTLNPKAPIYLINSTAGFLESYLEPPTTPNWTIGYYVINFGDGSSTIVNPVYYNVSSGSFNSNYILHKFTSSGFFVVNFTIITYNESLFSNDLVTNNSTSLQYLPSTFYNQVLSSNQHFSISYITTIYVSTSQQVAGLKKVISQSKQTLTVAEVQPGGPYSFDPPLDYEVVGMEVIANVYETLVQYNGSSASQLFPMVASEIPTVANGGLSSNYLNYTFYIRQGLKFSNGDPLTAWDAYISFVRALLFVQGSPGTPDWIIAQDLLPGGGWAPGLYQNGTALYDNITRAITYNNATQTITFHLLKPDPAFLDYLANPQCSSIMDWNWLVQHGAGITFTPAGFLAYTAYGDESNFNSYIRYNTMGSGPYEVENYIAGQSVLLAPNPYYKPIPNVPGYDHAANDTIYIEWLKDPETVLLMTESGSADIVEGLPNYYFPTLKQYANQSKLEISTFPTIGIYYFTFNWDINVTMMQSAFGAQYHIPSHYFANEYVRKAFAYSFNYTNYLNNIFGNSIYGEQFGFRYAGVIPKGMPGYIPINDLKNVPYYNLTLAKAYMEESGLYNVSVNMPLVVFSGDPIDYAAAGMWAQSIEQMDPNIQVTPEYVLGNLVMGYMVPGENPMPIYMLTWFPDYPYPSDYMNSLLLQGGWNPLGNGWNSTNLQNWGFNQEAQEFQNMTNLILKADNEPNETLALQYFDQAEQLSINLTLLVYTVDLNGIWVYSPSIQGMTYQQNPMYASGGDLIFIYIYK